MIARKFILLTAVALAATFSATAGELVGKWVSEFDSQIGIQNYTFEFALEGDTLVGTAVFKNSMRSGETPLKEIEEDGEDVSFLEMFSFEGNEIRITYTGKLVGDEMKLTRDVGEFATERIVATRVKESNG